MRFPSNKAIRLSEAQNHRCCYCGIEMVWEMGHKHMVTIDHVVPLSKQGTRHWGNEVAACARCNSGRKNSDALDYLFQAIVGMTPHHWKNWGSRQRKARRLAQLRRVFDRLGIELDENGRLPDSLRAYFPKPHEKKRVRVATVAASICAPGIT